VPLLNIVPPGCVYSYAVHVLCGETYVTYGDYPISEMLIALKCGNYNYSSYDPRYLLEIDYALGLGRTGLGSVFRVNTSTLSAGRCSD
jgi:hypothetical protein